MMPCRAPIAIKDAMWAAQFIFSLGLFGCFSIIISIACASRRPFSTTWAMHLALLLVDSQSHAESPG